MYNWYYELFVVILHPKAISKMKRKQSFSAKDLIKQGQIR